MQQFFTDTIQGRLVKDLIYTTPIPRYNTVSKGSVIYSGETYIYKSRIIKCNKTGVLDIPATSSQDKASYSVINNFYFGKYYPKFTERFASNNNYYDSSTHRWLGNLLRCYRDIWDIDLMPFYNCFAEDYISGLRITNSSVENSPNSSYRTAIIPIKFNKVYTIAVDCSSEVKIAPAVISNNNLVTTVIGSNVFNLTEMACGNLISSQDSLSRENIKSFVNLSYKNPIGYSVINDNEEPLAGTSLQTHNFINAYENQLYMLIQLPENNTSSICVLEGDYTQLDSRRVINIVDENKISSQVINDTFLGNLSLLQMNDSHNYAFADRLIEYLLWNVICNRDQIDKNIERVQDSINYTIFTRNSIKGVWDLNLRKTFYDLYMSQSDYEILDINGFVDKDIERYLRRRVK